jgi:peptidoglycan-associated lipoprotein
MLNSIGGGARFAKYPTLGIDSVDRFRWNRVMRSLGLFIAIALLAGCHPPTRGGVVTPSIPVTPDRAEVQPPAETMQSSAHPPEVARNVETLAGDHANTDGTPLASQLQDIFYDYDRSDLTEQASRALQTDAGVLKSILTAFPNVKIIIEGHCDERGSAEYNLALGDSRAARTAQALRQMGVAALTLETVSYGKENPQCTDAMESCWQKNRRAHLVVSQ